MAEKHSEGSTSGESTGSAAEWTKEETYWREHHSKQPYAKDRPYEHYAPAYKTGFEGAQKYSGRSYDEVEESLASDYEKAQPGSGVPWDSARPAVRAAWDRLAGVISPRDPSRGMRGSI